MVEKQRKRLPKSIRKYIRKEKSRIRREFLDIKKQQEELAKIYQKVYIKSNEQPRDISQSDQRENETG